jgi:hypothetical protein
MTADTQLEGPPVSWHTDPGPELTVVIPTKNERDNIAVLYRRLCATLQGLIGRRSSSMTIPMMELPKSFVTWLVKIDVCGLVIGLVVGAYHLLASKESRPAARRMLP